MRSSSAWFTYVVTKLYVAFLPGWHCRWPPWPRCMAQTGCPWPCCPCWPSCCLWPVWPVWPGPCAAQSRQARAAPAGKVTQPLTLLLHSLPPQPMVHTTKARTLCTLPPTVVDYDPKTLSMPRITSHLISWIMSWYLIWERGSGRRCVCHATSQEATSAPGADQTPASNTSS